MWDSPFGIEWDEGGGAMKLDRTSMLYGTLLLTGTGLLSQALGFLYRIALSRLIGAEVMGLYQLVMPVYSVLLSVTAVGLTAAVSNLSAEYHARGDRGAVSALLRRCLALFLALSALAAAVVIPFSDPISVYLLGDARTRLGLVLLLPCVLLTGVENLHKHYFYGTGNIRPPAAVELCEQFIRAGAVLGLLVLFLPQAPERTVGLIVLGMTACEVFSALTLLVLARRSLAGTAPLPGGPDRGALTRRAAAIALPVGLTSLLGNLMGAATSVLIPQQLVRAGAEVGAAMSAFGVMCGMTLPMLSLPIAFIGALGLDLVPRLARAAALGQREVVRRRLDRALQAVSALVLPSMALLAALGPALGRLLFREPTAGDHLPLLAAGWPSPAGRRCSPGPSTAWGGSAPPPATPCSPPWRSWGAPGPSCPCRGWGWRGTPPPSPCPGEWGRGSTGGRSNTPPVCAPAPSPGSSPPAWPPPWRGWPPGCSIRPSPCGGVWRNCPPWGRRRRWGRPSIWRPSRPRESGPSRRAAPARRDGSMRPPLRDPSHCGMIHLPMTRQWGTT